MKHVVIILLLGLSLVTTAHAGFGEDNLGGSLLGGQSKTQAYACNNCNSSEAKSIVIREAPVNNCSIYRNGRNASFCEPLSKEILIPVYKTREVFKFIVTTSINSQNRPVVNVISFPVTAAQYSVMDKFFDLYEEFEEAVSKVNHESSLNNAFYTPSYSSKLSGAEANDYLDCSNHPIWFFANDANARNIKSRLGDSLIDFMDGKTQSEVSYESLVSSGGVQVATNGAGANIGLQYFGRNLIIFTNVGRTGGYTNRLAFDVNLGTDILNANKVNVVLSLNRMFSSIDGYGVNTIFGGANTDLSGGAISECLKKFLEDKGESIVEKSGGGSGTAIDPFTGLEGLNNVDSNSYCKYKREYEICTETKDGTSCRASTVEWTARCN